MKSKVKRQKINVKALRHFPPMNKHTHFHPRNRCVIMRFIFWWYANAWILFLNKKGIIKKIKVKNLRTLRFFFVFRSFCHTCLFSVLYSTRRWFSHVYLKNFNEWTGWWIKNLTWNEKICKKKGKSF